MKYSRDENQSNPPCWNRDTQAHSLRVELADGSFYVFPYNHLAFAKFVPGNDNDALHVLLDTHEIQITGKHLREIGLAIQKLAVDWVKESPARYSPPANEDNAWITSITVTEVQGQ